MSALVLFLFVVSCFLVVRVWTLNERIKDLDARIQATEIMVRGHDEACRCHRRLVV